MAAPFHDVKIEDMKRCIQVLRMLSPFSAIGSLFAQSVALLTNEWLYTVELIPNPKFHKLNISADEFLSKNTVSGLWVLCQNEIGTELMTCSNIDYFSGEEYVPDPNDSTMAIPYASKKAAYFMVLSSAITVLASFICLTSNLCNCQRVFTFIAGVLFILSGLFILSCIVVYISTFKAEVGIKLRPRSLLQDPAFKFSYGSSFTFAVASLILTKITGTFLVFLYLRERQVSWKLQFKKAIDPLIGPIQSQTVSHLDVVPESLENFCIKHGSRVNRRSSKSELFRDFSPLTARAFRAPSIVGSTHYANDHSLESSSLARDNLSGHISFISGRLVSQQNVFGTLPASLDADRGFGSRLFPQEQEQIFRTMYSSQYPSLTGRSQYDFEDPESDFEESGDFNRDARRKTTPV